MAVGQILFKLAAGQINFSEKGLIASLVFNTHLLIAVTLYMVATVLWVWILSHMPLKQAYPLNALGFIIIPLASYFAFNEGLNIGYWVGVSLIIVGVLITQYFS